MLKILNGQAKTVTSAAIIIAGATLINKFVGLARDRAIAHYFGAGPITDAYYAAFKIPDFIYTLLVVGALTAGFIPTFTKLLNLGDNKKAAWRLSSNILNILFLALLVFCGLGIIFTPQVARLVGAGFSASTLQTVETFTRILFLSPIFLGLSMVMGGILQSLRRFVLYSLAPIFYNAGIIIGIVVLVPIIGVSGLAWGVILGAFLHFIIQFFGARQAGYRWQWVLDWKDAGTRLIGKLMIPRTLGLAVSQTHTVITTILASLLPAGSVAAYTFADNLHSVPVGIIGISFAIAIFPVLSTAVARNDQNSFKRNLTATIRQIIFLITPITVIFLLLRAQIVRVVLGSGAFNWTATIDTANALAFFAFSILAECLAPLLARAFFALSDTKTPLFTSLFGSGTGILAALILMRPWGIAGLALAGVISSGVNVSLLFFLLHRKNKSVEGKSILSAIYRIGSAGLAMAVVTQLMKYPLAAIFDQNYFFGIFGQGLIAGLAGLAIYALICYILRLPELNDFIASLHRRWLKIRNMQATELIETKD